MYPATITVETPSKMDNWRPLVHWFLAIPHLIVAGALDYVSGAVAFISWFVILFTGKLPEGLADFQVMILRYTARAQLYAGFMYEEFPPFDFTMTPEDPGGSPVAVNVTPALENRNRLTVGLRIFWLIPAVFYAMLIGFVGMICWFLAFFAILFTGSWPEGLRSWVMKLNRVGIRFQAYALLLTDEYPPFASD